MGTSKPIQNCVIFCVLFIALKLAQCDDNKKLTLSGKLRTFYKTFIDNLIDQEVLLSQMEIKQNVSLNTRRPPHQECNKSLRSENEERIVQKANTSSTINKNIETFTKVILKAFKGEKQNRHALEIKLNTLNVSFTTAVGLINTALKIDIDVLEDRMQTSDKYLENKLKKTIDALENKVNTLVSQTNNTLDVSFRKVAKQMNETWKSDIEKLEEKVKTYDKDLKTELKTPIDILDNKLNSTIRQTANINQTCTARIDELESKMETMHIKLESLIKENEILMLAEGNFALGKSASSSSNMDANIGANNAVDGNLDGNWFGKSCTHTAHEVNPWWRVDLAKKRIIRRVVIKNRADCCGERLRDLTVSIADTVDGEYKIFAKYIGPSHNDEVITLTNKEKVNGRFLKLQIIGNSKTWLTLCEVQAFYI